MEQTANIRWVSRIVDAMGVGICVLASIVAYVSGIDPVLEQQASMASRRQALRTLRKTCDEVQASAKTLDNQLAAAREELAEAQIRLQPSSRTNQRVAALAALLRQWRQETGAQMPAAR